MHPPTLLPPPTHLSVAAAQNPAPAATHTTFSPSAICTVHMALLDQESNGLRVWMGEEDLDQDLDPCPYGALAPLPPHLYAIVVGEACNAPTGPGRQG